jgi:hypothetical protein
VWHICVFQMLVGFCAATYHTVGRPRANSFLCMVVACPHIKMHQCYLPNQSNFLSHLSMLKTASFHEQQNRPIDALLCHLLFSTVNANAAGSIRAPATNMQVLRTPFICFDANKSFWSLAITNTCNALRSLDPFAGALLRLSPHQVHCLFCLTCSSLFT